MFEKAVFHFSQWVLRVEFFQAPAFWVPGKLTGSPLGSQCPSIMSAACSYQWFPAVPLVPCCDSHALVTVARSISWALPPRACLPVYRSRLRAHMWPLRHCPSHVLGNWPPWFPERVRGFCSSPSATPRFSVDSDHLWTWLLSLSSWVRFGGVQSLQSPWMFGTPLPQIKKVFLWINFCFQRRKRGARGNIWGFGVFVDFCS